MEEQPLTNRLETWVFENRKVATLILFGLLFSGIGIFLWRSGIMEPAQVQVLGSEQSSSSSANQNMVVADISGSVLKPGVYTLPSGSRIDDLLIQSGGLSGNADREWVSKNLNRAAKVIDGQKIYVPYTGEVKPFVGTFSQTSGSGSFGLININTATESQLDSLAGIGATRASNIIKGRPYSSIDELLSKKVLPQSVFDKIKDQLTAP